MVLVLLLTFDDDSDETNEENFLRLSCNAFSLCLRYAVLNTCTKLFSPFTLCELYIFVVKTVSANNVVSEGCFRC